MEVTKIPPMQQKAPKSMFRLPVFRRMEVYLYCCPDISEPSERYDSFIIPVRKSYPQSHLSAVSGFIKPQFGHFMVLSFYLVNRCSQYGRMSSAHYMNYTD